VFILGHESLVNMADNMAMLRLFEECNIGLLLCLSEGHRCIFLQFN